MDKQANMNTCRVSKFDKQNIDLSLFKNLICLRTYILGLNYRDVSPCC